VQDIQSDEVMKVIFDTKTIRYVKLFQTLFPENVIACAENFNTVYFVVDSEEKIMHINREKIRNLERLLKKRVRIIFFSENLEEFIKSLVPQAKEIKINEKEVRIIVNKYDKPKVIGKNKSNLMVIEDLLKKVFDINEVKIV